MNSITIHNLDDSLDSLIRDRAKKQGTSLNKMIQSLLKQALGLKPKPDRDKREDFLDLFDTWTEADEADFNERLRDLSEVDESDWQ